MSQYVRLKPLDKSYAFTGLLLDQNSCFNGLSISETQSFVVEQFDIKETSQEICNTNAPSTSNCHIVEFSSGNLKSIEIIPHSNGVNPENNTTCTVIFTSTQSDSEIECDARFYIPPSQSFTSLKYCTKGSSCISSLGIVNDIEKDMWLTLLVKADDDDDGAQDFVEISSPIGIDQNKTDDKNSSQQLQNTLKSWCNSIGPKTTQPLSSNNNNMSQNYNHFETTSNKFTNEPLVDSNKSLFGSVQISFGMVITVLMMIVLAIAIFL